VSFLVVNGAALQCSFGVAPGTMIVLPKEGVLADMPAANIMDNKPIMNIAPFGMCNSPANPQVAAATAAALGVLTPMPCLPVIAAPWAPGSTSVMIGTFPALNDSSVCNCNWGGVIKVNFAGQTTTQITA
jgi:hypothetical protein